MAYPVKWFASNMQGAPVITDSVAGGLAALMKAVLVTGFGQLTLNSLAWDATENAAKAVIQAGHAYLKDSVILVEGALPDAYNGEHRVKKVSTTEVWFELDAGNPGAAGSGAMTIKVPGLGWTQTFESTDKAVAIYRPTDVSASGNVSLRIDNSAFSGWTANNGYGVPTWLAKVQLVEDVVDINTYTLIYEHRWPATQNYSNKSWELIGDSQLFYWLPAIGNYSFHTFYCFGYLKSIRPGDRYHAVLVHYFSTNAGDNSGCWNNRDQSGGAFWGTLLSTFNDSSYRAIARPYHQLFGSTSWWTKGLFTRFGQGLNLPNAADNAFYLSTDPIMVLETGNNLRGYLPGLVVPYADIAAWDKKNFSDLPALPGKVVRFLRPLFTANTYNADNRSLVGLDLTGPWR